jgi:formate dehydrogenase subunit delta
LDIERLHYMANQIARNFAVQGETVAAEATAQHIRNYWDGRMKAAILNGNTEQLNPVAQKAIEALRRDAAVKGKMVDAEGL